MEEPINFFVKIVVRIRTARRNFSELPVFNVKINCTENRFEKAIVADVQCTKVLGKSTTDEYVEWYSC